MLKHILTVIQNSVQRSICLDAVTYSIGRSSYNTIVLEGNTLSRQHAILLRLPLADGSYRYRLIDGSVAGKRSTNGITVNGRRCQSWDLQSGDLIIFAEAVQAIYQIQA